MRGDGTFLFSVERGRGDDVYRPPVSLTTAIRCFYYRSLVNKIKKPTTRLSLSLDVFIIELPKMYLLTRYYYYYRRLPEKCIKTWTLLR